MLNEIIDIQTGVLLKVDRGFWTSGHEKHGGFKSKVFIPKGEILEIRYPYAWHFRTQSNHYDHASAEVLIKNCSFFGEVKDGIRFANKHDLKQILEQELYHKRSDYKLTLKG